jgi:hypothetical protein
MGITYRRIINMNNPDKDPKRDKLVEKAFDEVRTLPINRSKFFSLDDIGMTESELKERDDTLEKLVEYMRRRGKEARGEDKP